MEKGLILIAASYDQLLPYIDESQLTGSAVSDSESNMAGPGYLDHANQRQSNRLGRQFDSLRYE